MIRVEDIQEVPPVTDTLSSRVQTDQASSDAHLLHGDGVTDGVADFLEGSGENGAKSVEEAAGVGVDGADPTANVEAANCEDKVYNMPENWPWIKQLKRPSSCVLSKSRLPCVRKAVSHLEQL